MSSYSTSSTVNQDMRNFAEGGSAVAGQGSAIAYPTSVSVFGSPGSAVGDITFVSQAPAPVDTGLRDQLSGILSALAAPVAAPAIPGAAPAEKPNYILWAAIALGAILLLMR